MQDPPEAGPSSDAEEGPSRLDRAAGAALVLLRHRELIVAAMEALREKQVLTQEQEVKVLAAYEQGGAAARSAIHDLLEKLQASSLGHVVIDLAKHIEGKGITPETVRGVAQPYLRAVKDTLSEEAKPYVERARRRLVELKALEEPSLRRLEAVSQNLRSAGKDVAEGLKGLGREAADELVKQGKRAWMSPATEELERELLDWTVKTLPKAERAFVRGLIGVGMGLILVAVLVAARETPVLREAALFVTVFLLVLSGLAFISWGRKTREALRGHQTDLEELARLSPSERRLVLTQRWAKRAQEEGLITSNEAQTVIMQTLHAAPEGPAEASSPRS